MAGPIANLKSWLRQQADYNYLSQAEGSALADIGLCRDEALEMAAAPRGITGRMTKMAQAYDLPAEALSKERWRNVDMARACASCSCVKQCQRWLRDDEHDVSEAGFCPNVQQFRELAGLDELDPAADDDEKSTKVPHHYL